MFLGQSDCIFVGPIRLYFLFGITHFRAELQSNCTALSQSESSHSFVYMIISKAAAKVFIQEVGY